MTKKGILNNSDSNKNVISKVQGLEIDWACVTWDADLQLKEDWSAWQHFQLRSGTKWQRINKEINKDDYLRSVGIKEI